MNIERTTDMMSAFVDRSAGCPLKLFFAAGDFEDGYDEIDTAAVTSLVDTLKECRWEIIDFDLRIRTRTSPLLRLLDVPAHSKDTLRRVTLTLCVTEQSPALSRAISSSINLQRAPYLTSLDIDIPGGHLTETNVDWEALTYLAMGPVARKRPVLDLYDFSSIHAFEILRRCPNLLHCKLSIYPVKPVSSNSPFATSITLPHLHTLSFIGHLPPPAFANALELPALHTLSILDDRYWETRLGDGSEPHDVADSFLCALVRQNGSRLRDLTFDYGSLSQSALVRCLEASQNVTSLVIVAIPETAERELGQRHWGSAAVFDSGLLGRMTPKFDASGEETIERCVCPNLTKLVCRLGPIERNPEDWILLVAARRMLRRGGVIARLDTASVKFDPVARIVPPVLEWNTQEAST